MSATLSKILLLTAGQLFGIPASELGRCELIDGEVHQMAPTGFEHGKVSIRSGARQLAFVDQTELGTLVGAETGFLVQRNLDTVRAPDAAFIKFERVRAGLPKKGFYSEAPALVVEVVSPNDTVDEVDEKMRRWMAADAKIGWGCIRIRAPSPSIARSTISVSSPRTTCLTVNPCCPVFPAE